MATKKTTKKNSTVKKITKGKKTAKTVVKKHSQQKKDFTAFKDRDIILFAGITNIAILNKAYDFTRKENYKLGMIYDKKSKIEDEKALDQYLDFRVVCDLSSHADIVKTLKPYEENIKAVMSRSDSNIKSFSKIIPHVPYVRTPSAESLIWSNDKIQMRRILRAYNKRITPKFMVVRDFKKTTLKKIQDKIDLPVVLKPVNLNLSMFVTVAYHEDEMKEGIKKILNGVKKANKNAKVSTTPEVLVEDFMEGDMYSIDSHVSSRGTIYHCPPVYIKTGFQIGFDDFFGYLQITPTRLKKSSIENAQLVCEEAIHALGLRSTTVHTELMKTEDGWKVIEVNPRIGGFRDKLYELSFGFSLTENDIKIRIPQSPTIKTKAQGYSAVMKVFAKKEGEITSLKGIKRIMSLKSLSSISQHKKVGDRVKYAKNGGKSVADIFFYNADRSKVLADIRRCEQMLKIEVE